MSQADDDDAKPWTDNDLKEALRRINAGEINFKEAENYYGISPRTLHRQRAIENMRAQLNPEKAKKIKPPPSAGTKKDVTVLRKAIEMSCTSLSDIVSLLDTGTEEVKQLLNHECDLIYECKVCKNLFRSLVNFISHKRIYCCDMYSVLHSQSDENEDGSEVTDPAKLEAKLKAKENLKEFTAKPFRITCRKDLTAVLKRISAMSEFIPVEPILHLQSLEKTPCAFQQSLIPTKPPDEVLESPKSSESTETSSASPEAENKKETVTVTPAKSQEKPAVLKPSYVAEKRFRCPLCTSNFTIKKSVARHLKFVHHKSEEQLEKLKHRIQMHYVKIKTATGNAQARSLTPVPSASLPLPAAPASLTSVSSPLQSPAPALSHASAPPSQPLKPFASQPSKLAASQTPTPTTSQTLAPAVCPAPVPSASQSSPPLVQLDVSLPSRTPTPSQPEGRASHVSSKTNQTTDKGEWEKDCPCHRHFTNRNSYASHMRVCRQKLALKKAAANTSNTTIALKRSRSLLPIVSLTPITVSALATALENVDSLDLLSGRAKKLAAMSDSKKDSLPPTVAATSSSKKIGIQVRMNYRKEGVSQPNSINGTSAHTAAPASSQSSADNSRRNSVASVTRDEKPDVKSELLNGHNTRSSSKLTNILNSLLQKQETKEEGGDADDDEAAMEREDTNAAIAKMEKSDVTVGCEDCRATCPINEYVGGEGTARSFRCALRNCDFRSGDKSALLPHLSAQHPVLSESELAEVESVFVAEASGQRLEATECCRRVLAVDAPRLDETRPQEPEPLRAIATGPTLSGASKRKSNPTPSRQSQSKRKPNDERRVELVSVCGPSVKMECAGEKTSDSVKQKNVGEKALSEVPKKVKKSTQKDGDGKVRIIRTRKPMKPSSVPPMVVQNGVQVISSDEEDEPEARVNIIKLDYANPVKKQSALPIDKVSTKLPKTNCLHHDVSSPMVSGDPKSTNFGHQRLQPASESVPNSSEINLDADLDPSTMSEEILKRSIMTIIFGKGVPTEKFGETMSTSRDKSPASSSSSDGGKEKRYRFRPVKPDAPMVKTVSLPTIETKDNIKVPKVSISMKTKAPR